MMVGRFLHAALLLAACNASAPSPSVVPRAPVMATLRLPLPSVTGIVLGVDHHREGEAPWLDAEGRFEPLVQLGWPAAAWFGPVWLADDHDGVDLEGDEGDVVLSMLDGRVDLTGEDPNHGCLPAPRVPSLVRRPEPPGFVVVTSCGAGPCVQATYEHLRDVVVSQGDLVEAGQVIGALGRFGCSASPHLHVSLRAQVDGAWQLVDPFRTSGKGHPASCSVCAASRGVPKFPASAGWTYRGPEPKPAPAPFKPPLRLPPAPEPARLDMRARCAAEGARVFLGCELITAPGETPAAR